MMARVCEPEFVLDRLVESLVRYLRRNPPVDKFAASLKERGEDALRMRTGPSHEGDVAAQDAEEGMQPLNRTMSAPGLTSLMGKSSNAGAGTGKIDFARRSGSVSASDAITPVAPSLHPVEEEDHEPSSR
jgi:potassium channel subfamily K